MIILSILFFVTALIYSSVGFGGGSTYLALLLLAGISYQIFPIIALTCNIIVVSGNSFNYIRAGNLNLKILLPYLYGSIPFAFFGGSIQIEKELFEIILFFVLAVAGFLLLINFKSYENNPKIYKTLPIYFSSLIGIVLGFISGYSGGITSNPTYREVTYGDTGHFEVVEIIYNKELISYEELLKNFWINIDPFDAYGQFCDKGYSYRSVAFYQSEKQRQLIERDVKKLEKKI